MKLFQILALATALVMSLPASAQWQWVDKDGRKVFSDRAPPPEVPEQNILKRPGSPLRSADVPAAAGLAEAAARATPQTTGQDKDLMAKKKQAADAEAAKRRQEEEKIARIQADNCERARRAKAALDAGQRVTRLNDKGEREFLDDAGVAAESQRLQGVIADNCK